MDFLLEHLKSSLFYQLAAILLLAGIAGFIGQKLRQPLIVVFIAVGLLVGPSVLGLVTPDDQYAISTLAKLGIALLLFMVGLKLNPEVLKTMGVIALIAGGAQVAITTILGGGLLMLLGFNLQAAIIGGLGLAFSSTIIVVKLLSDQREIESLYGKMALGILIVQDIVVIITVVVVSSLAENSGAVPSPADFLKIVGKLVLIIAAVWIFMRYIAERLITNISRSSELMVIFAIGFAAAMAALCDSMGLSKELGGLLAGVSLAPTAFRTAIYARLSSLRDFLLLFFFIGLGAQLTLDNVGAQITTALIISGFVLFGKPLIIMAILGALGYRKRTYFQTGALMSQISEFSLILSALALTGGYLTDSEFNIMTLTGMITIAVSTYIALNSVNIYKALENNLGLFERENLKEEDFTEKIDRKYDVIIFGLGRYGAAMAKRFQASGAKVLGIDFDPAIVRESQKVGIPAVYGDASDPEFPAFLPLESAHTIVLCIPHTASSPMVVDTRRALAKSLRTLGFKGRVAVTSHRRERDDQPSEEDLSHLGVDIILRPYQAAAESGAEQILAMERGLYEQEIKDRESFVKAPD